jgi:two-component system phosphate regulon sensor histidine kinase PhoR
MHKRTSRTIVILSLSIILPLIGYMLYQMAAIRQNEQLISSVYEEQLKSVLFSVNQYSNDYMSTLMDKIENLDSTQIADDHQLYTDLKNIGFDFYALHLLDDREGQKLTITTLRESPHTLKEPPEKLDQLIQAQEQKISLLIKYASQGYRKIEPVDMFIMEEQPYQVIMVILSIHQRLYLFTGLIDPLTFTQEVLSPKMQQIAEKQLILSLREKENTEILFATDTLRNDWLVTSQLWLFPEYEFGVSPRQDTVKVLIDQQRKTNLTLIGLLSVFMTIGIIMIIRNMQKEARLNQAKSDFVSNVSHELRTPLALISMFAETILMGRHKDTQKLQEYMEIIHKETHRLTNIVNRILNFSRIEANRRVYHLVEMDLRSLVEEIVSDYSYHLEQNGFVLIPNWPETSLPIRGDREAIYEAVIILIDNAMKYSEENKQLQIALRSTDSHTHLTVSDQGIGIDPTKLHQVFDKFFRVSDNDKYVAQGAGLGLSILKHIMDAHDGSVDVQSEVGKGSHFTLTFHNYG